VSEERVIAGKYRVERVIGAGGMGQVLAARHVVLDQLVALKVMLPEATREPGATERFLREARAAARLRGEHVARVFDVGMLDDGAPFIVMEYLEGCDLGALIAERGALAPEYAVDLVLEACVGVAEAHAAGIVHRDLKPQNLFLARRGDGTRTVKILDFGISKLASASGVIETRTSTMMGSPAYMSPEQMRSAKHVDARTDLWSLGAILYHLLAARTPFVADSVPMMCALVLSEEPDPLPRAGVPPELAAIVMRCLAKDPAMRWRNLGELAAALVPFGSPAAARHAAAVAMLSSSPANPERPALVGAHDPTVAELTTHTRNVGELVAKPRARRRWSTLAIAMVLVGAIATWIGTTRPGGDAPTAAGISPPVADTATDAGAATATGTDAGAATATATDAATGTDAGAATATDAATGTTTTTATSRPIPPRSDAKTSRPNPPRSDAKTSRPKPAPPGAQPPPRVDAGVTDNPFETVD
jgi:serine/threonine-protein kinase